MPPERLTGLDASFLYLERPANHMHVAALSVFDPATRPDGRLPFDEVRRTVASRLHLVARLRKKVVEVPMRIGLPVWVDDPGFDLDLHVRRSALPSPGGHRELAELVQEALSRPLDRTRALWEMTVIEGLEGGHVATLMKVHHAMMDGVSGMQLAAAMYDLDAKPVRVSARPWHPEALPAPRALVSEAMRQLVVHPFLAATVAARALSEATGTTDLGIGAVGSGVRSILDLGPRPASPFDVTVGPNRRFSTTDAPFERFRQIKSALGGTVNDVLLTVVGGALHRYLREQHEPTRGLALRVLVPVSVRSEGEAAANRVAPAFVDLPVGPMAPARRLALVRERTRHLKESSMAMSANAIIGLGGYAPGGLLAAAARVVSKAPWFNLVVSNIPGPQQPMFLAGARLVACYPSMPLGPTSALSIACTSLSGTMAFGVTADRDGVPDVDRLSLWIEDSLSELSKAAGL
jgi:WS/DGAT/MGAT family acyltransferase